MIPQYKNMRFPGRGNPDRTATAMDFPERSIPYVQDEREMLECERKEAPNSEAARIEVPDDESAQKTKPIPIPIPIPRNRSVQFSEAAQHDRNRGAKGKAHCTEHRDARRRHRSPYPTREPKTRQKAIPIPISKPICKKKDAQTDVTRFEDDTTGWVDDTDDDDADQDVAMERNPLASYPRVGQSLTHPKRRVEAVRPRTSLLTEGLRRYARLCEDAAFVERVREALERQGERSRREKSRLAWFRKEGEKTRIPICRKPDGRNWGFDVVEAVCDGTTVFGAAVVPVYRDDSEA
ncbi:hypothetical protein F5B21DRAFT_490467 [Xylaria acuta]|nr:hypothetical protein F5B21DRAFT_490467 [Xylaria acuta]